MDLLNISPAEAKFHNDFYKKRIVPKLPKTEGNEGFFTGHVGSNLPKTLYDRRDDDAKCFDVMGGFHFPANESERATFFNRHGAVWRYECMFCGEEDEIKEPFKTANEK